MGSDAPEQGNVRRKDGDYKGFQQGRVLRFCSLLDSLMILQPLLTIWGTCDLGILLGNLAYFLFAAMGQGLKNMWLNVIFEDHLVIGRVQR